MAFEWVFNNLYGTFSEGEVNIIIAVFHMKQSGDITSQLVQSCFAI